MDGVLADTERDGHRPAFNQAFEENKLNTVWDVERYGKLLETGGGKERMTAHWNEVGWPESIAEEDRVEKVKELHLRKTDIFMEEIREWRQVFPSVPRPFPIMFYRHFRTSTFATFV